MNTLFKEQTNVDCAAYVVAVQEDIVTIKVSANKARLIKNEMIFICPVRSRKDGSQERLKAEVLRVRGQLADAQVFENTHGVTVGDRVELTGKMLSVTLGPGLLGKVYDGLQNPLEDIASAHGIFLPRGVETHALDTQKNGPLPQMLK